jgi:hypothetical protein
MSFSLNSPYKKMKSKKGHSQTKEINSINPDILNYIQKVQNDKEKTKVINNSKNQLPIQVERILTNKLVNSNIHGLSEDMTFDKDKRFAAKKGLLYLLNNLSSGTFCPDIDEYFAKMREAKIEEFKKKPKLLEMKNINDDDLKMDKKKPYNLVKKSPFRESSSNIVQEDNIDEKNKNVNLRLKENKIDNSKYSEINEKYGLKKYNNDYDAEDLINLYDENEIKDNTFQININKEKRFKMKLKNKKNHN